MNKNLKSNPRYKTLNVKKLFIYRCLPVLAIVFGLSVAAFAQQKPLVKRTTSKNSSVSLGAGGTVTIVGAPEGSIIVEGWQKNEVEISAEIELQAENEADLAELAKVNGFVVDEDFNHLRILTTSTQDKDYMKRVGKKFPKRLLNMPLKIDFRIKVPMFCDLEINGGRGDLRLEGVEGAVQIKILEGDGNLSLIGGTVRAVFGKGNVDVKINGRNWRGRSADVQLAAGTMNVWLPANLNAEVQANVLRAGTVENAVVTLKPRERTKFTEKSVWARAGGGGALLSFTVGDGTLKIQNQEYKAQD